MLNDLRENVDANKADKDAQSSQQYSNIVFIKELSNNNWLVDFGASVHMTKDRKATNQIMKIQKKFEQYSDDKKTAFENFQNDCKHLKLKINFQFARTKKLKIYKAWFKMWQ